MVDATSQQNNKYVFAAIFILFFGAYTEVGLNVGGGFVPSFFAILFCVISYLIVRPAIFARDIFWTIVFFVFVLFSAIFAPNYSDISARFVGVFQIAVAFITFIVTLKILCQVGPEVRFRFSIMMLRILVILTLTEYLGFTSEISDYFRLVFYENSNYGFYQADARDLAMGSSIRPKVFASEPSLVAIGVFVLVAGVVATSKSLAVMIEVFLYILVQYFLINSPIVLLSFIIFVWVLANRFGLVVYGVSFLLMGVVVVFYGDVLAERMGRFSISEILGSHVGYELKDESSERLRLVYPYISVSDTFGVNPFTGLGISGKRSLELYSSVSPVYQIAFGNNAFATIFIYFGIFGSACFFVVIYNYLRVYVKSFIILIGVIFLFMQTMGGFETVRFWMYLGFLVSFYSGGVVGLRKNS